MEEPKILKQWAFVGYGVQLDRTENPIGYVIVHPKPDESLEDAVKRAKQKLLSDPQRYTTPCEE